MLVRVVAVLVVELDRRIDPDLRRLLRPDLDVQMERVDPGRFALLHAIAGGATLGEAVEAAVAAAPEAIVIPNHAVEALGGVDALLERPEIRATPVGASRRVIVIDGLLLLGFGPRTPDAVEQLAAELYGD